MSLFKNSLVALFSVIALLSIDGCCSCRDAAQNKDEVLFTQPFEISLSTGGGVSGLVNGYILSSDGSIKRFSKWPGKDREMEAVGSLDLRELLAIKNEVDEKKLFELNIKDYGNMTTYLHVTDGNRSTVLNWTSDGSELESVPTTLRDLISKIQKVTSRFDVRKKDQ